MTQAQKAASDPTRSVWVSASAGTGKTKVLVDRLLAILYNKTPISNIICLTFTKAAALEMRSRLLHRLQFDALDHCERANLASTILENILESPESLKIMTMHAYCQSLLQKFPFEAGITPFFKIMDESLVQKMLMQSMDVILTSPPTMDVENAIEGIAENLGEHVFKDSLIKTFSKWHRLRHLQRLYPTIDDLKKTFYHNFGELEAPFEPEILSDIDLGKSLSNILLQSTKDVDRKIGAALAIQDLSQLTACLLKRDGDVRQRLYSADFKKKHPHMCCYIEDIAHYLAELNVSLHYERWMKANFDFWIVIQKILDQFAQLKEKDNSLDYHDLILHTLALLSDDLNLAYIHQRLDYTLEHILVDEAQDNSPEQWLLIYKLVDLFIREDTPHRTLFVVGDMKQSIYGFQGAAPHLFETLRGEFQSLLTDRKHVFESITLRDSFRTTPEILQLVDRVFEKKINDFDNAYHSGMGEVQHHSHRTDPGWVVFKSLQDKMLLDENIENESDAIEDSIVNDSSSIDWQIFDEYKAVSNDDQILAKEVAKSVEKILQSKWIVPSTNTCIEAKDILILMRNRGKLNQLIIQALKQLSIPTEGPDRLVLSNRLAIHDILALLRFLCLPQDDWSLVHVLKSPLVNDGKGFDESVICRICVNRTFSVWGFLQQNISSSACQTMLSHDDLALASTVQQLKHWLSLVDYDSPHEILNTIISDTIGAFENRLGKDVHLLFEALLDTVLELQQTHSTLSELLYALEEHMPIIQRDPTKPKGTRIMTIHGSKGLEAPVVILVDRKERHNLAKESVLWADATVNEYGEISPLICLRPKSTLKVDSLQNLRAEVLQQFIEEKNRLLYVALTRPRDGLLVIGSGQWTSHVGKIIQANNEISTNSIESSLSIISHDDQFASCEGQSFNYNTQIVEPNTTIEIPNWYHKTFDDEQNFVTHNQLAGVEIDKIVSDEVEIRNRYISLMKDVDIMFDEDLSKALERGIIIHYAFEMLCKTPKTQHDVVWDILKDLGLPLNDKNKILYFFNHDLCKRFFEPEQYIRADCEVDILHNKQLFRIDRLIEFEDEVWILDYKTGKRPLKNTYIKKYHNQVKFYQDIVKNLYDKKINIALLWVDEFALEICD